MMVLGIGIGFPELVVILCIVLLIFGAGKLPQIGDALGRGIKNFRKATSSDELDVTPPRRDALPSADQQASVPSEDAARHKV